MMYLYVGYLVTQLYTFFNVLAGIRFVWSVHLFSTIVLLAFAFIPVIGYWLAKHLGAQGQSNRLVLFMIGLGVGLIEKALYKVGILGFEHTNTGVATAFLLMFLLAFLPSIHNNNAVTAK